VLPAVEDVALWYHTLELPGGVLTPGWFDLRGVVEKLPWPEVQGRRCLDVATYDGFFAFELERRGAREVMATDIGSNQDWDLPGHAKPRAKAVLDELAGAKGAGFEVARRALGSSVQKRIVSVYELSQEAVGTFDVVVCGSLMLHLRDPIRALEAIRSVCGGWFLSIEEVSLPLSLRFPRRPIAEMRLDPEIGQWWVANRRGHARLLEAAGFEVHEHPRLLAEPFGVSHPPAGRGLRPRAWRLLRCALLGSDGVPHSALLARPTG